MSSHPSEVSFSPDTTFQLVSGACNEVELAFTPLSVGNKQIFIFPDYFQDFIERASRDLGSPVRPTLSWRDYGASG